MLVWDQIHVILFGFGLRSSPKGKHLFQLLLYIWFPLVDKMRSKAELFVMGLSPVDERKMPFGGCLWYANEHCDAYEKRIEEVCINQNVPFLPTFKEMNSDSRSINWLSNDGIHLNSSGHLYIYQRLRSWEALQKWRVS